MSNTNYDVELNITYDDAYKHYIPTYTVAAEDCLRTYSSYSGYTTNYHYYISFDEGSEIEMGYSYNRKYIFPLWAKDAPSDYYRTPTSSWQQGNKYIQESGIYSKIYFRNPHKDVVSFRPDNCGVQVLYQIKAQFEIQWNSVGFAANNNAWFKCSTVQKNTYKQYEWDSATVYFKKSTEENYSSVAGTISGSWSDVRIDTPINLQDGYVYDIYIEAISDDGETAVTPVAQFTSTDAQAVATCISPSGAFTSGEVTFIWSHTTEYGTPQYAYDLQYSSNNGASWTTVASHVVTTNTTDSATLTDAGVYKWRVRTYNSNDVVGEWAEATFVNQVPAAPPTNLQISTKGRPTVSWASASQSAYQVQFLSGDTIVYDSGAVYTSETNHFVNQYFDDTRAYSARVRIYNALGEISDWVKKGYQQPIVTDVEFTVEPAEGGGATLTVVPKVDFVKYYVLRNNKVIAQMTGDLYTDVYANGVTNYSVVGVTPGDQSDIKTIGINIRYPHASLVAQNGQKILINKRVDSAYEIQTTNQADVNKVNYIGDDHPTHYPSDMRLKTFTAIFFDEQGIAEEILGSLVFYADNFGNSGWCMVTAYDKTDNFVKNSQGVYANEVSLTLEVTNYDDSIEYPL